MENNKDNGKEAVDGSDGTNTLEVDNMRGKCDDKVEAGSDPKHGSSLSEEGTAMRLLVRVRAWGSGEEHQQVDQEQAGHYQHVQQQVACLHNIDCQN